jgi:hypothetical protein
MSRTRWRLAVAAPMAALVLGGTLGSGCRSAGPVAPRTTGPARMDPLSGWVGQTRILRHRGDKGQWNVKRQDLRSASGTCDVAVEVRQARFDRGTATFTMDMIGRPRLMRRGAHQERCGDDQAQIMMNIAGFDPAASTSDLEAALAEVLYTPEAYLRSYTVPYQLPVPVAAKPERAKVDAVAKVEAAKAEAPKVDQTSYKVEALKVDVPVADHHLTKKAARVLWVDAITRDPSGRISHEAEVEFKAVVGSDGRVHHPKLSTALSADHEKRILRVLPLWRFEPARRGADPAAAAVIERMVFRIY